VKNKQSTIRCNDSFVVHNEVMANRSFRTSAELADFGLAIRRWRAILGLTASQVAERANITRDTLRSIETGTGTASLGAVFAVLEVLGIQGTLAKQIDPLNFDLGRDRAELINKKRVRTRALG